MSTMAGIVKSLTSNQKALAEAVIALGDNPPFTKVKAITEMEPHASTMAKLKEEDLSWTWSMIESSPSKPVVTVAVSGCNDPVGSAVLYRIAAGEMLGLDQPVALSVLGADPAIISDVEACNFPLLKSITVATSPSTVMSGAAYALLLSGDMAALGEAAPKTALVAALGCTNAYVASKASNAVVTGITRAPQLAAEVVSWGGGIVDISHSTVAGKWALQVLPSPLLDVGDISVGMQADAAVMHMRDWANGSGGEWASMGVPAIGDYGMGVGFFFSVPCSCSAGEYKRIGGVTITADVARAMETSRSALITDISK